MNFLIDFFFQSTTLFRLLLNLYFNCMLYLNQVVHPDTLIAYHKFWWSFVSTDDLNTSLLPSGFVQEELEDQADLCTSGFLPKIMCANSPDNQAGRVTARLTTETKRTSYTSVRAIIVTPILVCYLFFLPSIYKFRQMKWFFFSSELVDAAQMK